MKNDVDWMNWLIAHVLRVVYYISVINQVAGNTSGWDVWGLNFNNHDVAAGWGLTNVLRNRPDMLRLHVSNRFGRAEARRPTVDYVGVWGIS